MNVWVSLKGLRNDGFNGFEYPYFALSPTTGSNVRFDNLKDVEWELCRCYDECINNGVVNIGETLYVEHFFFCNTSELIDPIFQQTIKEYNFCKTFNCPPYPSIQDTPAEIFEDFLKIEKEVNMYKESVKESNGS